MPTVNFGGPDVELTNLDKVLFPEEGITKGEFIGYYEKIAPVMLPHIKGRLISMQRFPEGAADQKFFQKQAPQYFPEWVNRVHVNLRHERHKTYITCDNKETLVYLANLACIPHVWLSRVSSNNYPDRLIFDLDPPEDNAGAEPVRYAALILKEVLGGIGVEPFLLATGGRGFHVVVPLDGSADFKQAFAFARQVGGALVELAPEQLTMEFAKGKRAARVFIDIFRNAFAQTAIAPYAVKASPAANVATPVLWRELSGKTPVTPSSFNIRNIFKRLSRKGDIWKDIDSKPYSIPAMARALERNKIR